MIEHVFFEGGPSYGAFTDPGTFSTVYGFGCCPVGMSRKAQGLLFQKMDYSGWVEFKETHLKRVLDGNYLRDYNTTIYLDFGETAHGSIRDWVYDVCRTISDEGSGSWYFVLRGGTTSAPKRRRRVWAMDLEFELLTDATYFKLKLG